MASDPDTGVSEGHLIEFGEIIYLYATAESGIKIALSDILRMDLGELLILTEPYSSQNLRNVAKSIIKQRTPEGPLRDRFVGIIGRFGTFGRIRNHIAHSRWTAGKRTNSIRPFGIDIRSGSAKFLGIDPDEEDFTPDDLLRVAGDLLRLNQDIVQFLDDIGATARMEQKAVTIRAEIDARDGNSTKDS